MLRRGFVRTIAIQAPRTSSQSRWYSSRRPTSDTVSPCTIYKGLWHISEGARLRGDDRMSLGLVNLAHTEVNGLEKRLCELQEQLKSMSKYSDSHPAIIRLRVREKDLIDTIDKIKKDFVIDLF